VSTNAADFVQQPANALLGDDGVLMVANDVLEALRVPDEAPRGLPDDALRQLGGVACSLPANADGMQRPVGRVGRQGPHRRSELAELSSGDVLQ
jgi:hypothetical protein